MYNAIIKQLFSIDEVELIYSNTVVKNNNTTIIYNIIVSGDNVLSDLNLSKRIIAIMEIIKVLYSKYNITINYDIKSGNMFEEEIMSNKKSVVNKFSKAELIYSKDDYFQNLIESNANKKCKRA